MSDERMARGLPSLAGCSLNGALSKATRLGFQSAMSLPDGLPDACVLRPN